MTWAVFVDRAVHVAPDTGDFDVGLVDEPRRSDRVPARSGCVDEQRREAMHPPEQGDVIDLDTTLHEEFVEIAIRLSEPQVSPDANMSN